MSWRVHGERFDLVCYVPGGVATRSLLVPTEQGTVVVAYYEAQVTVAGRRWWKVSSNKQQQLHARSAVSKGACSPCVAKAQSTGGMVGGMRFALVARMWRRKLRC